MLSNKGKVFKSFIAILPNILERIMDMALDMRDCVQFVPDPRPGVEDHIKIR